MPNWFARQAALRVLGVCVVLASALIGLSWLTASLFFLLHNSLELTAALAITGVIALLPILTMSVVFGLSKRHRGGEAADLPIERALKLIQHAGRTIETFAQRNPLSAVAVCAAVGILAAKSPKALGTALHFVSDLARGPDKTGGDSASSNQHSST